MKILREVNGEPMYFELTEQELLFAYEQQEHIWDMNYIRDEFGENEEFDRLVGEEKERAISGIAWGMREKLNDMAYPNSYEAGSQALEELFKDYTYENDWICVYKDALGYEDDDNLTYILVPLDWLREALESEGEEDIEGWWDEYTADSTDYIARAAVEQGMVLKCSNEQVAAYLGVEYCACGSVETQISMANARAQANKNAGVDLAGYELMSSQVDGYDIYRKILRNKDGAPVMGVWAAAKEGVSPFAISYQQARGEAPIEPSEVKALSRKLGEMLLP